MAGHIAAYARNPTRDDWVRWGGATDYDQAVQLLSEVRDKDIEKYISQTWLFLYKPKNWNATEAVANELLEHKKLDGVEIELIIGISDGKKAANKLLLEYREKREK